MNTGIASALENGAIVATSKANVVQAPTSAVLTFVNLEIAPGTQARTTPDYHGTGEHHRTAAVEVPTTTPAVSCSAIAAIKVASAAHFHRTVAKDGEFTRYHFLHLYGKISDSIKYSASLNLESVPASSCHITFPVGLEHLSSTVVAEILYLASNHGIFHFNLDSLSALNT